GQLDIDRNVRLLVEAYFIGLPCGIFQHDLYLGVYLLLGRFGTSTHGLRFGFRVRGRVGVLAGPRAGPAPELENVPEGLDAARFERTVKWVVAHFGSGNIALCPGNSK